MERVRQDLGGPKETARLTQEEELLALRSSEQLYRSIVEEQPELVCRFTPDGVITFANEAWCRFFGKSSDEIIGTTYDRTIHPDDLPLTRRRFALLCAEAPALLIENRVFRGDGEIRWIQWSGHVLLNNQGKPVECQATGRDLTERRDAEQLLSAQYEVTLGLAEAVTVNEAMRRTLQSLCQRLGWDLAILWRNERSSDSLRFEGIWHVPGVESVMVEHSLLPEMDLPGRVLRERKTVWIPDVVDDLRGAERSGFNSVLAFPARAGENTIAVVECFSRFPRVPRSEEISTLEAIGHQIGNYRERKTAEESLRHAAEELEIRVRQRTEQLAGALEALSNSEMRFRAMFEGAPLGIALVGLAGVITERNPVLERMLGHAEGNLYGVQFDQIIHPADRSMAARFTRELLNGKEKEVRVELRFLTASGGILWGSLNVSMMSFEGNEAPFTIAMIKDITERKVMEEELRQSENRFRTVFEESPVGIALVSPAGVYVQTNHALEDMLGFAPGELEGKTLSDLIFLNDVDEDVKSLAALVSGQLNRYQKEKRYVRKDGSVAWGNLNAAAIRSGAGEFLYSLHLVEDITRRKETEQLIHMLAHTITSMNECVIITDADYRVLSVNKAFLRTFGYEEPDILGRTVGMLRAPDASLSQIRSIVEGTLTGGWTGEITASRKSGEVFPIVLSTSVVREEHGSPIALVGIARDVTEQKRLQHRLEEAERKRLEDLRRFAINVQRAQEEERQRISRELHDDICQRLSGMKLNMEVLEDDVRSTDRKMFRTLRSFRKQFEQTISEVRRMSSNLRPTVLDDFGLTIAINLLAREFEKAHKTRVKVETGDPSLRRLDPQVEIALYRIAQESLANIAKHAGASLVTVSLRHRGREMEFVVQDDGKGFDEHDTMQARREGHGLGLISMRERAELLGGTCVIESAKNRGTSIHVTIPLEANAGHEEN